MLGLTSCLIGVLIIIVKGDYLALIKLKFTKGDLWMLGASIGWALYSIFLFLEEHTCLHQTSNILILVFYRLGQLSEIGLYVLSLKIFLILFF